jgi:hypothetical protein
MKYIIIIAGAGAMLAVLGNIDSVAAQMTRQQAWSRCLKTVNATEPRTAHNDAHRTASVRHVFRCCRIGRNFI